MNGKFVSFASIIERVYRDTEYEVIPWQDAAEDVMDVLRLIGVSQSYIYRTTNGQDGNPTPIIIEDFKGEIPLDVASITSCRMITLNGANEIVGFTAMHESLDLFFSSPTVLEEMNTEVHNLAGSIAPTSIEQRLNDAQNYIDEGDLADASDTMQTIVDDVRRAGLRTNTSNFIGANFIPKYKVNNGYIYTNFKHGFVEMSYKALPIDEFGMPMVPDEIKFIRAVVTYLTAQLDKKRWRTTKNNADKLIWQESDREALWYIGAARSKAHNPNYDLMESIKNMMLRSIPKLNEHKYGWKNTDLPEQRRF